MKQIHGFFKFPSVLCSNMYIQTILLLFLHTKLQRQQLNIIHKNTTATLALKHWALICASPLHGFRNIVADGTSTLHRVHTTGIQNIYPTYIQIIHIDMELSIFCIESSTKKGSTNSVMAHNYLSTRWFWK